MIPDISKHLILKDLQEIERTFYEYIEDGKSETASKLITQIHILCKCVRRG